DPPQVVAEDVDRDQPGRALGHDLLILGGWRLSMVRSPAAGRSAPTTHRRSVVLPAPFGPTTAPICPARRVKETWSRTVRLPYRRLRSRTSSACIHPLCTFGPPARCGWCPCRRARRAPEPVPVRATGLSAASP